MKVELAVTVREQAGKGVARQLRKNGKIPAVLYGQGECVLLTANPDELVKILKAQAGSTVLISLTVDGAKAKAKRTALLRDYQVDPITGSVLHADLFEISMDKPIRVKVPVHVTGAVPVGVKEGGVLHNNTRELHIECLPAGAWTSTTSWCARPTKRHARMDLPTARSSSSAMCSMPTSRKST